MQMVFYFAFLLSRSTFTHNYNSSATDAAAVCLFLFFLSRWHGNCHIRHMLSLLIILNEVYDSDSTQKIAFHLKLMLFSLSPFAQLCDVRFKIHIKTIPDTSISISISILWLLLSFGIILVFERTRQLIDALNTTSTFQQKRQKYQSSMNVCAIQSQTENFCFNSFPNHQTTLFQLFRRQIYTTNTMVYDWKHTRCTLYSVFIVLSEHALAFQLIKWKMWSHCHRCTLACTLFSCFRFCSISYK